jgi:hypothetical protein
LVFLHLFSGDDPADGIFNMVHNCCSWVFVMIFVSSRFEHSRLDQHRVPSVSIRTGDISIRVIANGWMKE